MLNINRKADDTQTNEFGRTKIDSNKMSFKMLSIDQIFANPNQPRTFFDKQELENLAQSIKENGVLQPILVRSYGNKFEIVSGERRYRASKIAGIKKIPAIIREIKAEKRILASLIENIQRQDLNPIEEAKTLREILLTFDLTHVQLAQKIGKSRSALTNRLRLLQLPEKIQQYIINGKISAGHAKMLAGLKSANEIEKWAKKIIKDKLSVYEIEKLLSNARNIETSVVELKKLQPKKRRDLHLRAFEEKLQDLLGAKVRIQNGKTKSKIEIEFYDNDDLERIFESFLSHSL